MISWRLTASQGLSVLHRPLGRRRFAEAVREGNRPLRLEIGAWTTRRPGWISTDVHWRGHCYLDATRTWPVLDGSLQYVYADNVIEHLTLAQSRELLKEAFRAMAPGGRIRLVTPNVGELARLYLAGADASKALRAELESEGYLIAHQVDVLRFAFQDDGHDKGYLWDAESLTLELSRAGFVDIEVYGAGMSDDPNLCGLEARVGTPVADICVIVEGAKPRTNTQPS